MGEVDQNIQTEEPQAEPTQTPEPAGGSPRSMGVPTPPPDPTTAAVQSLTNDQVLQATQHRKDTLRASYEQFGSTMRFVGGSDPQNPIVDYLRLRAPFSAGTDAESYAGYPIRVVGDSDIKSAKSFFDPHFPIEVLLPRYYGQTDEEVMEAFREATAGGFQTKTAQAALGLLAAARTGTAGLSSKLRMPGGGFTLGQVEEFAAQALNDAPWRARNAQDAGEMAAFVGFRYTPAGVLLGAFTRLSAGFIKSRPIWTKASEGVQKKISDFAQRRAAAEGEKIVYGADRSLHAMGPGMENWVPRAGDPLTQAFAKGISETSAAWSPVAWTENLLGRKAVNAVPKQVWNNFEIMMDRAAAQGIKVQSGGKGVLEVYLPEGLAPEFRAQFQASLQGFRDYVQGYRVGSVFHLFEDALPRLGSEAAGLVGLGAAHTAVEGAPLQPGELVEGAGAMMLAGRLMRTRPASKPSRLSGRILGQQGDVVQPFPTLGPAQAVPNTAHYSYRPEAIAMSTPGYQPAAVGITRNLEVAHRRTTDLSRAAEIRRTVDIVTKSQETAVQVTRFQLEQEQLTQGQDPNLTIDEPALQQALEPITRGNLRRLQAIGTLANNPGTPEASRILGASVEQYIHRPTVNAETEPATLPWIEYIAEVGKAGKADLAELPAGSGSLDDLAYVQTRATAAAISILKQNPGARVGLPQTLRDSLPQGPEELFRAAPVAAYEPQDFSFRRDQLAHEDLPTPEELATDPEALPKMQMLMDQASGGRSWVYMGSLDPADIKILPTHAPIGYSTPEGRRGAVGIFLNDGILHAGVMNPETGAFTTVDVTADLSGANLPEEGGWDFHPHALAPFELDITKDGRLHAKGDTWTATEFELNRELHRFLGERERGANLAVPNATPKGLLGVAMQLQNKNPEGAYGVLEQADKLIRQLGDVPDIQHIPMPTDRPVAKLLQHSEMLDEFLEARFELEAARALALDTLAGGAKNPTRRIEVGPIEAMTFLPHAAGGLTEAGKGVALEFDIEVLGTNLSPQSQKKALRWVEVRRDLDTTPRVLRKLRKQLVKLTDQGWLHIPTHQSDLFVHPDEIPKTHEAEVPVAFGDTGILGNQRGEIHIKRSEAQLKADALSWSRTGRGFNRRPGLFQYLDDTTKMAYLQRRIGSDDLGKAGRIHLDNLNPTKWEKSGFPSYFKDWQPTPSQMQVLKDTWSARNEVFEVQNQTLTTLREINERRDAAYEEWVEKGNRDPLQKLEDEGFISYEELLSIDPSQLDRILKEDPNTFREFSSQFLRERETLAASTSEANVLEIMNRIDDSIEGYLADTVNEPYQGPPQDLVKGRRGFETEAMLKAGPAYMQQWARPFNRVGPLRQGVDITAWKGLIKSGALDRGVYTKLDKAWRGYLDAVEKHTVDFELLKRPIDENRKYNNKTRQFEGETANKAAAFFHRALSIGYKEPTDLAKYSWTLKLRPTKLIPGVEGVKIEASKWLPKIQAKYKQLITDVGQSYKEESQRIASKLRREMNALNQAIKEGREDGEDVEGLTKQLRGLVKARAVAVEDVAKIDRGKYEREAYATYIHNRVWGDAARILKGDTAKDPILNEIKRKHPDVVTRFINSRGDASKLPIEDWPFTDTIYTSSMLRVIHLKTPMAQVRRMIEHKDYSESQRQYMLDLLNSVDDNLTLDEVKIENMLTQEMLLQPSLHKSILKLFGRDLDKIHAKYGDDVFPSTPKGIARRAVGRINAPLIAAYLNAPKVAMANIIENLWMVPELAKNPLYAATIPVTLPLNAVITTAGMTRQMLSGIKSSFTGSPRWNTLAAQNHVTDVLHQTQTLYARIQAEARKGGGKYGALAAASTNLWFGITGVKLTEIFTRINEFNNFNMQGRAYGLSKEDAAYRAAKFVEHTQYGFSVMGQSPKATGTAGTATLTLMRWQGARLGNLLTNTRMATEALLPRNQRLHRQWGMFENQGNPDDTVYDFGDTKQGGEEEIPYEAWERQTMDEQNVVPPDQGSSYGAASGAGLKAVFYLLGTLGVYNGLAGIGVRPLTKLIYRVLGLNEELAYRYSNPLYFKDTQFLLQSMVGDFLKVAFSTSETQNLPAEEQREIMMAKKRLIVAATGIAVPPLAGPIGAFHRYLGGKAYQKSRKQSFDSFEGFENEFRFEGEK